jgi:hypothetical protein
VTNGVFRVGAPTMLVAVNRFFSIQLKRSFFFVKLKMEITKIKKKVPMDFNLKKIINPIKS